MTTICDKHDEIDNYANYIANAVREAKDMGERMENTLYKYKDRIIELENEIADLNKEHLYIVNELTEEISNLEYELSQRKQNNG